VETATSDNSFQLDILNVFLMAFIMFVLGILFKQTLFEMEIDLMAWIRENHRSSILDEIWMWIIYPTELKMIQVFWVALYLYSDPVLAFKCTFVTIIQIFIVSTVKLISQIPRPYWLNHKMRVSMWALDYSGPSDHIWVGALFYNYLILIFYYKYAEGLSNSKGLNLDMLSSCFSGADLNRRRKIVIISLLVLSNTYILITGVSLFYLGQTFLIESMAGLIYSVLLVAIFIRMDADIHKYCEHLCFDIYKSRRNKFMLLFYCIGAFVVTIIYYRSMISEYNIQPQWMKSQWLRRLEYRYEIGLDYTYFDFANLFTLIGAAFGCAFATTHIDGYLLQNTETWKRALRWCIGTVLYLAIIHMASLIPADNYLTEYVLVKILPNLFASYVVFGIFPYTWQFIGKLWWSKL